MKLVSNTKTGTNTVELKFQIDKDVFDKETEKVFNKKKSKITVQGFRPGKAPRSIVEKIYGKGIFYEDAINNLLPVEYNMAVKEAKLEPVAQPTIDVETIDENGVLVVATVIVKPEISIADYKGITCIKEVEKVTAAEVKEEIERVRERQGREIEVTDRAAKDGDTANINYEGFVDGAAFDGGKGENYDLKLGSGTFIPGFEEQICGKNIGDEFDVKVTFPTEYHAKELAGKEAIFKTKLNGIKMTELPTVDDEFVKDISEFDTLTEYKADVKAKLQKKKEEEADRTFESNLIVELTKKVEGEIPEEMYDAEAENLIRDYDMNLRQSGLDLQSYMKYTGVSIDGLKEEFRPRAEEEVKLRLALEKIAELENLTVADEEVEKELQTLADTYKMEVEKVKLYINPEDLKGDLLTRKAMDLVKSTAISKKPKAKKAAKADEEEPTEEKAE